MSQIYLVLLTFFSVVWISVSLTVLSFSRKQIKPRVREQTEHEQVPEQPESQYLQGSI